MTKKQLLLIGCFASLTPMLSGCASVGGLFAGGNKGADGPAVTRAAPLIVPPDFALQPEQTGAVQSQSTQDQTLEALFGGSAQRSASERSLTASANPSDPGIRSSVGDPSTVTVNKGVVTRDIIAAPEGDGQSAQAVIPG